MKYAIYLWILVCAVLAFGIKWILIIFSIAVICGIAGGIAEKSKEERRKENEKCPRRPRGCGGHGT